MKKTWFILVLALSQASTLKAQEVVPSDTTRVELKEAVIRGARVVSRIDGKLIYPSEEMTQSATSGYSLLKMLPLPNVKVDDINESIAATNTLVGNVQVRINDVEATSADIQALQPKEVEKVEFIDRPGVRYGEGIGIVINVITHPVTKGYVLGASATYVPKANLTRGNAYAKLNSEKNEVTLNYSGAHTNFNGYSTEERTNYLMEDNTRCHVERDSHSAFQNASHNLQARYSRIDADKNAFLATFSAQIDDEPRNQKRTDVTYPDGRLVSENTTQTEKVINPGLDLYWKTNWGKQHTFIANASGTYVHTDYDYRFASFDRSFGYGTLGKTWALRSEAIYENRMKTFTLSAGMRFNQQYTDNDYSGDASLRSQIHLSKFNVFAQLQGSLGKLRYMAGMELTREYYHQQGEATYDKLWLQPKLNLFLPISKRLSLNYSFTTTPSPSKLQNTNNIAIVTNEMECSLGNPNRITARRDDHTLTLNLQSPRLQNSFMVFFRHNAHPAMQHFFLTEDNRFATTFLKGRRIDFLMLQNFTSWDIIPKHLNAYLRAEMLHIQNVGQDYHHRLTSFNFDAGLMAWIGNWTLMASADNGFHFMENEYEGRNIFTSLLSVGYQWKQLNATLFCQNPFKSNGKVEEVIYHNRLVEKHLTTRNRDTSFAVGIKLTWKLSKGRRFKGIERNTDNTNETETGVAKSGR
ncbi:MAG: hypothetical protein ACI3YC_06360 [Alloprevotella sp.]